MKHSEKTKCSMVSAFLMSLRETQERLFPFETAGRVRTLFCDPAQKNPLAKLSAIDSFYSAVNGPADSPAFRGLLEGFGPVDPQKKSLADWAAKKRLSVINQERGLGIQPFGARL